MKHSTATLLVTIVVTVLTFYMPVSRYWESFGWFTAVVFATLSWFLERSRERNAYNLERTLALNSQLLRRMTDNALRYPSDSSYSAPAHPTEVPRGLDHFPKRS